MAEFTLRDATYRSSKMSGLTQIHVLRRASPVMLPLFKSAAEGVTAATMAAVVEGLGALPDDAMDYILQHTLAVVERRQSETVWAKVQAPGGRTLMFSDIAADGLLMLAICANVLIDNYYPLFREAPELFKGGGLLTPWTS